MTLRHVAQTTQPLASRDPTASPTSHEHDSPHSGGTMGQITRRMRRPARAGEGWVEGTRTGTSRTTAYHALCAVRKRKNRSPWYGRRVQSMFRERFRGLAGFIRAVRDDAKDIAEPWSAAGLALGDGLHVLALASMHFAGAALRFTAEIVTDMGHGLHDVAQQIARERAERRRPASDAEAATNGD